MAKPVKIKIVRKRLKKAGCVIVRTDGPHEIHRRPDGETFSLPTNHGKEISPGVMRKIDRFLKGGKAG